MRLMKIVVPLALLSMAFAGCIAGDDVDPDGSMALDAPDCVGDGFCGQDAVLDEATGRDLRVDLTADDVLGVPQWRVGDVFEQHIFYGNNDDTGEHIQTMVVDDSGGCYQVATTSQTAANFEASFNIPVLGCIGKTQLQTGLMFNDWEWMYDFPLSDGKTWSGRLTTMINWNDYSLHDYEFTLMAVYDPAINTWNGDFPGFIIEGITTDGETLLRYNYVPAVGWFSHFWIYDLTTDDPDDVIFHAMSMGTSTGYTGPYYLNDATTIMQEQVIVPIFNGQNTVRQFDITDHVTTIKGVIVPIACAGAAKVIINTPSNQQHQYDHVYEQTPDGCAELFTSEANYAPTTMYSVYWVEDEAEAGTYTMTVGGAGLFGYFAWLTAITEKQYELTEAEVPAAADGMAEGESDDGALVSVEGGIGAN